MNIIDFSNYKFPNNREQLRRELTNIFLSETPGTGKRDLASRYRYIVRNIGKHQVYLQRPAQFNNGFDFTLNVSEINFNAGSYNDKGKLKRATTRPSHAHIYEDLSAKKAENVELFKELLQQIDKIYHCKKTTRLDFPFESGYQSEIILECIKWLFAEQDITYWNYSGRAMLYSGIKKL